jgi:hypothetical protein
MTMTSSTPLKLSAVAFAVLWTFWMLWRSGSFDRVNITMLTICGAVAGYFWYLAMRWVFERLMRPPAADQNIPNTEGTGVLGPKN